MSIKCSYCRISSFSVFPKNQKTIQLRMQVIHYMKLKLNYINKRQQIFFLHLEQVFGGDVVVKLDIITPGDVAFEESPGGKA